MTTIKTIGAAWRWLFRRQQWVDYLLLPGVHADVTCDVVNWKFWERGFWAGWKPIQILCTPEGQRQIEAEAERRGVSLPECVSALVAEAVEERHRQRVAFGQVADE